MATEAKKRNRPDTMIEVTKATRQRLKLQAVIEKCSMKEYVTRLSKRHEAKELVAILNAAIAELTGGKIITVWMPDDEHRVLTALPNASNDAVVGIW
jgi:hypothetical protein